MRIFPRPVDDQLAARPQLGDAVQPLHIGKEPRQIGTAIIMEADQRAAWPYVDLRNACLHAVHLDFDQPQQILRSGRQFPESVDKFSRERSEERRVGKECVSTYKSRW